MNIKYLLAIFFLFFYSFGVGSAQTLSVKQEYKYGDIHWQSSTDGQTWNNIANENDIEYEIPEEANRLYRAKITDKGEVYYSSIYNGQTSPIITSSISFTLPAGTDASKIKISFAPLKYNKRFALSLTSDDQKLATWNRLFKYINGGWIDNRKNYHYQMATTKDGGAYAPKALNYTDGFGTKRRFAIGSANFFTNTQLMDKEQNEQLGYLVWDEQIQINDFDGTTILHDVQDPNSTAAVGSIQQILNGINNANDIIYKKTKRKPIVLADPNGDYNYIEAAMQSDGIKMIIKGTINQEFKNRNLSEDLNFEKLKISRLFTENYKFEDIRNHFLTEIINKSIDGVHMYGDWGVHGMDDTYIEEEANHTITGISKAEKIKFLDWLRNEHGEYNRDDIWMPTCDEVIQYKYLNSITTISHEVTSDNVITITLNISKNIPEIQDFYWQEYTLLIDGIKGGEVESITADESIIPGMTYGNLISYNNEGRKTVTTNKMMINLNYDKTLVERAEKYTMRYQDNKDIRLNWEYKNDAEYFVQRLRPSLQETFRNRLK